MARKDSSKKEKVIDNDGSSTFKIFMEKQAIFRSRCSHSFSSSAGRCEYCGEFYSRYVAESSESQELSFA